MPPVRSGHRKPVQPNSFGLTDDRCLSRLKAALRSPPRLVTNQSRDVARLAAGSIVVGVLVLGLKLLAYYLTGSVALYSDALESTVNIAASIAALVAIRLSAKPADANHPYGHAKAEYLSAVLEGALIVVAALAILHEAYLTLLTPQPLDWNPIGLGVNGLACS